MKVEEAAILKNISFLLDSVPRPCAVLDENSVLLAMNRDFSTFWNLDQTGIPLHSLLHVEDTRLQTKLANIRKNPVQVLKFIIRTKAGRQIKIRVKAFKSDTGWLYCESEDMTEGVNSRMELDQAVVEARNASSAKSDFLANISHEIRTPLHTIVSTMELLEHTKLDDEQSEYAQQIRFASDVLLGLINDVLDFSRIEAGKLSLDIVEFDLYDLVAQTIDLFSLAAHKKKLEMIVEMDTALAFRYKGDPLRIRQIILNLVNNAVKFTFTGSITVRCKLKKQDRDSLLLELSVDDTGIGIPDEKQKDLFSVFHQLDASTTRKFGGSGLGLSICKSLAHLMGGSITLESREGKGSCFTVEIPLHYATSAPDQYFSAFENPLRILIVDDSTTFMNYLSTNLQSWGLKAFPCASAEQALYTLRQWSKEGIDTDLVLIKMDLPVMDGWHLAAQINADKSINNTRLILLSPAGTEMKEAKMTLLKWFDGYLRKPVKIKDLYRLLVSMSFDELELPVEDTVAAVLDGEPLKGKRILVVEDNEINRNILVKILSRSGSAVATAQNGEEACAMAVTAEYDLIFMDLQMPVLNGYEAAKQIRDADPFVPIVALTASALQDERDLCLSCGMNDIIVKPYKRSDIDRILAFFLLDTSVLRAGKENPVREPEIFNRTEYVATIDSDEETLKKLFVTYSERTPELLAQIREDLDTDDKDQIRIHVHTLKGTSMTMHFDRIGKAALVLEGLLETDEKPRIMEAFSALLAEWEIWRQFAVSGGFLEGE